MAGDQLSFVPSGRLFFGDNLEVMRRHLQNESVDLVYLDPPFNSNRSYNVLFRHRDGRRAAGQVKAFDDTWSWTQESARVYQDTVEAGGEVSKVLRAFRDILGTSDMLAYLTMMTPRLVELRRVLRHTGTLYLHCDPTASHYLKILLDGIFGPEMFAAELVWKRTGSHSLGKGWDHTHDSLLVYTRSSDFAFNKPYEPYSDKYKARFRRADQDGRSWQDVALTGGGTGTSSARSQQPWRGHTPPPGRNWSAPRFITDHLGLPRDLDVLAKLDALDEAGFIYWPANGGTPRFKQYLDMLAGNPVGDVWTDIAPINARAAEKLHYPTQKPLSLLERIIATSSNEGDVILDPFCGCGTAIDAAQRLGRSWIGIDVTTVAIDVIRERMAREHHNVDYVLTGEPGTLDEAKALADLDKWEFEAWACRRVGVPNPVVKKGKDGGIDARLVGVYDNGESWQAIVQAKGGRVTVPYVRDLHGTVQSEGADFGVFVTLLPPTRDMRRYAADVGYTPEGVARLQIITVEDIVAGLAPQLPAASARPAAASTARRLKAV